MLGAGCITPRFSFSIRSIRQFLFYLVYLFYAFRGIFKFERISFRIGNILSNYHILLFMSRGGLSAALVMFEL